MGLSLQLQLQRLMLMYMYTYTYGLSCSAGAMTTTNRPIVREKKRQKDMDTAVDLSVNYEDYIVAIAMYSL